jgi:hypothetical protein
MRKWKVSVGDPPTRPSIGCLDHAHCNEREDARKKVQSLSDKAIS